MTIFELEKGANDVGECTNCHAKTDECINECAQIAFSHSIRLQTDSNRSLATLDSENLGWKYFLVQKMNTQNQKKRKQIHSAVFQFNSRTAV